MQTEPLYLHRVDALLAYLDGFKQRSEPFASWQGGRQTDGSFRVPRPAYAPDVIAFFAKLTSRTGKILALTRQAGNWLDHPHFINTAGYERLRAMLTYCLRGEAESAGHWDRMLVSGKVIAVLQRLRVLRNELPQALAPHQPAPALTNRTHAAAAD